jgi:hypothetical protein
MKLNDESFGSGRGYFNALSSPLLEKMRGKLSMRISLCREQALNTHANRAVAFGRAHILSEKSQLRFLETHFCQL